MKKRSNQCNHFKNLKKIKVLTLTAMSLMHTVVGFLVVFSILLFSLDIDVLSIDLIAFTVPLSFVLFNRCVHIDFYNHLLEDDIESLPDYTKDAYFFNQIQKTLFNKEIISKARIEKFKGGNVSDIAPFMETEDPSMIQDIFNEKLHYVVINCILITTILIKYDLKYMIPVFITWFFYVFSQ